MKLELKVTFIFVIISLIHINPHYSLLCSSGFSNGE